MAYDDDDPSDETDEDAYAPDPTSDPDAWQAAIDAQVQQWADPATPPPGIAPEPDPGDGSHPFDAVLTQAVGAPMRLSDLVTSGASLGTAGSNPQEGGQSSDAPADEGGLDFHFGKLGGFGGSDPSSSKIQVAYNSQNAPGLPHVMSDLYPGLVPPPYSPFPAAPTAPLPTPGTAFGNSPPRQIPGPFSVVPPVPQSDRVKEGMDFYQANGMPKVSAALMGGAALVEDPKLDPREHQIGGGSGRGLYQWGDRPKGGRQADFKKEFGTDVDRASYEDQLLFSLNELRNNPVYAGVGLDLFKGGDVKDLTDEVMQKYEQAGATWSLPVRQSRAQQVYDGTIHVTSPLPKAQTLWDQTFSQPRPNGS